MTGTPWHLLPTTVTVGGAHPGAPAPPPGRHASQHQAHRATTQANVENEIDRYIAWPGQALAYMVGRREIRRLSEAAEHRLGARFDIRSFHRAVLGSGAVPLGVLDQLVTRWANETDRSPP